MQMRLQKLLAMNGFGSRRSIEAAIDNGEIFVDGKLATLGCKASADSKIVWNNRIVKLASDYDASIDTPRLIMYHKPVGQVCSRVSENGCETVFSSLPKLYKQRWVSVGRLDINTSGVLLFTTDGDLANKLQHPSANLKRTYMVRFHGEINDEIVNKMLKGVHLGDGEFGMFSDVEVRTISKTNSWMKVSLTSGKYREVRRICDILGLQVNRLIRIAYGHYELPQSLRPGSFIDIKLPENMR